MNCERNNKMAVKFIIDSASDVLPGQARAMGAIQVPLQVMFGEETYLDAVDLSHEAFFQKLADSKILPTTSQATPEAFAQAYAQATQNGDEAVVITISGELSGTCQSAVIAAEDFPGKIHIVDSRSATIGERVLLMEGLKLAKQGLSAGEIAAQLDGLKEKVRVIAVVDTLEYLKKGGRISAATAVAGTLLNIKPAIEVKDGAVAMAGTARGLRKANQLLRDRILGYGGINWKRSVAFVYSGREDALLQQFLEENGDLLQAGAPVLRCSLGSVIGTHVGPGAYGVAFIEE